MGKTKIKIIEATEETKQENPVLETESTDSEQKNTAESPKTKISKKGGKKSKIHKIRSKKYLEVLKLVDPNQQYPLKEAVELTQKTSYSKFPGSMEVHINTSAKNLRGTISLPYSAGKQIKILAFGKEADKSGADIVGTDETISEIEKGKINFDTIVTTPDWMPKLAKIAKILGPKGLMPSPKNDTVTDNLTKAVAELKGGKTEYKTQTNAQVIHLTIGKTTQIPEEITSNIKALYNTIGRSKIKKITLSASMGPGVKVNLSSLAK